MIFYESLLFLDSDGEQWGPIDVSEFALYGVDRETHVWCEGMEDWMRAGDIPELWPSVPLPSSVYKTPMIPPVRPSINHDYVNSPSNCNVRGKDRQEYARFMAYRPDNHMEWAVLVTVLISPLFGGIAIAYASQVKSRWAKGDEVGARESAHNASMFCWIGVVVAIVFVALVFA